MCGILAALGLVGDPLENRKKVVAAALKIRHRGPDDSSVWQSADGRNLLAFERLQIIDPSDSGRSVFDLDAAVDSLRACSATEKHNTCIMHFPHRQPFVVQTPEGTIAWALYVVG